jgi:hypothetical protein
MRPLLHEAGELPERAVERARGIAWVKPPDHLAERVPQVRAEHGGALAQVHGVIDRRLQGRTVGEERGAFYAASELALIAEVFGRELTRGDVMALRAPWEHLLAA